MSINTTNLNELLKIAHDFKAQNLSILSVFDLDSTLFNVSTRSQKILSEFAEKYHLPNFKNIKVKPEDWGIKEAVIRAGFSIEKDIDLLKSLRDFWSERFFSNEYLHYDTPCLGAVSFVQDLAAAGCEIIYLTGRDQKRMNSGTLAVLKKWGFPVDEKNIFLKPEKSQEDELFKHEWFVKLNRADYNKIYLFENEPININAILNTCPEVEVIFLDTTHSRKQEVTTSLTRIKNFRR